MLTCLPGHPEGGYGNLDCVRGVGYRYDATPLNDYLRGRIIEWEYSPGSFHRFTKGFIRFSLLQHQEQFCSVQSFVCLVQLQPAILKLITLFLPALSVARTATKTGDPDTQRTIQPRVDRLCHQDKQPPRPIACPSPVPLHIITPTAASRRKLGSEDYANQTVSHSVLPVVLHWMLNAWWLIYPGE